MHPIHTSPTLFMPHHTIHTAFYPIHTNLYTIHTLLILTPFFQHVVWLHVWILLNLAKSHMSSRPERDAQCTILAPRILLKLYSTISGGPFTPKKPATAAPCCTNHDVGESSRASSASRVTAYGAASFGAVVGGIQKALGESDVVQRNDGCDEQHKSAYPPPQGVAATNSWLPLFCQSGSQEFVAATFAKVAATNLTRPV